ncbi:MAG: glycoside hydrolase family 2 protein, partial [Bacteroidota bacterium]|nr:glycoside hydrolase family 2 protein [Bacteroidota bacterium]
SPIKVGLEKYDNYPYVVHSSSNDLAEIGQVPGNKLVSPHLRKAQYHFGWDWGPRLVTSGIWLPVYLKAWNDARIIDLNIVQNDLTEKEATMTAVFEIEAENNGPADLSVLIGYKKAEKQTVNLQKGVNTYNIDFVVKDPRLWWSNGLGEASLYEISGQLATREGEELVTHNIGIRNLELVREKDKDGTSFYVKLNGNPVFMKGANYIPCDVFLDRVTPEKYEKVITAAKECNFNMLRVWGGGIYEKDLFYDLCDQNGILIWQDFMFACNMYPGDQAFLENVKAEAEYTIKRLRNHPCMALWCGNNEVLVAWLRWGWKREVERTDKKAADAQWKAYKDIFLNILPGAIQQLDPKRFYWSSSPQSGDSIPVDFVNGDDHYWGVWWGKDPFSDYQKKIARFMTEYGFQSFPEFKTVKTYTKPEDWNIYSEVMRSHQRSSIGNETIEWYMLRDYRKPKDFESFLYTGQVLQAEGIKMAMEGHRMKMPYNMGSLFWQINDVWPVASWSSTDYYVRWKAQQYYSKKAYAPVLIAPTVQDRIFKVCVVSDRLTPFSAQVELKLMDFDGKIVWSKSMPTEVIANSCQTLFEMKRRKFLKGQEVKKLIFVADISQQGKVLSHNTFNFVPVRELELPVPNVSSTVEKTATGYRIILTTDKVARNVYLVCDEVEGFFSDNYFDLLPGEMISIDFTPDAPLSDSTFKDKLKIRTIRDAY